MKPQPFATKWRVVFSLFASCGIFALPAYSATCSSSNLPTGPTAYVATSPNLVTVLDASTNTAACTISVGASPKNLAVSPDGSRLFVENDTDASVSVIDLSNGTVTSTIALTTSGVTAPMTANLAVSPDGTFVYVVSLPQTLTPTTQASLNVISLPSLSVSGAISVVAPSPATPTPVTGPGLGISFSPDATKAYIATEGLTYIVTTSTNTISATTISVRGGTAAVDPNGDIAYVVDVASAANTVSKITTATNAVSSLNPTPTCSQANTTAITPDNAFAYYTCQGSNFVQKIDTGTNTVSATVNLASTPVPRGIAITSDGASAYIANNAGSISVVSVSGNSVTTTIAGSAALGGIGFRPVQLSISPTSQSVPSGTTFQFNSMLQYAFGSVTWSVSCTAGGSACGTVDSTGKYIAPNAIPSPNDVKVIATSTEIPLKSLKYPSQSVSAVVTITPSQLAFKVEPANSVAGSPLATVTVAVEDASGNTDTSSTASITVSSTSAPLGAASVTGTTMVNAVAGVATFSNLILSQVGTTPLATTPYTYTLTATSVGLTSANSTPAITIAPGAPAQLAFSTQPASGTAAGNALTNVVVYVEDSDNNVVTSGTGSNASITMTPASTPSGIATFSAGSTNPVSAVGGVATFSNLILTQANIPPPSGSTTVTAYNYTMTAASASPALTSPPSNSFTILPASATKLAFTTQPANGTAGVALGPFIAVVEDAFNNVLTSGAGSNASVTVTSTAAPATPAAAPASGTTTVVATGGVATFSNLILSQVGTTPLATTKYNYTLTALSGPLTPAISTPTITIVPGTPAQLAFATEPVSGTPAGSPLAPVVVYVEDGTGFNVVTNGSGSNASVTMTSSATPATPLAAPLGGTPAATAMNGVATFNNLILTQVGTTPLGTTPYNYTLTAKSSGLTSANSTPAITIVPGAAAQLVFNAQPASGTPAGNALVPVVVYVEDATGLNVVTSGAGSNALITMTPASTPPGITTFSAGSANSVFAANGVATFSALILTQANVPPPSGSTTVTTYNYTMTAASATPALTSPPSNPFTILPATAAKLVFTTEPAAVGSLAGSPLSPALGPVVTVEDNFGNALTSGSGSNALITITSSTMPAAPVAVPVGGTTMVAATGGVAAFSNLLLTQVGTTPLPAPATVYDYSLTAKPPITFPSVASATSTPFVIAPGAPTQLAFATEPVSGAAAGSPLAPITVYVEDATGLNVVTNGPPGSNPSITISSSATPASPLAAPVGGTLTVVATGGVATFSNLILTQVGTTPLATTVYNYTLTAKSSGLTSTNSTPAITIVPGAPTQLVFNTQPVSGTTAGNALAGVVVYVEDATGLNVVTSGTGSNASITMSPASTPLGVTTFSPGSTNPVVAAGGVATFSNLILTQANIPPPSGSTTIAPYTYTTSAASTTPALTSPPSNSFTILPATATKLVYTTQPANGIAGSALGTVIVAIEDAFNNVLTTGVGSNASITMTPASSPLGITTFAAGSTNPVMAVGGVASFNNLILAHVGTDPLATTRYSYTLTGASSAPVLTTSASNPFTIGPGAATQLAFSTQPAGGTTAGNALATVVVYVEDVTGLNVVTSDGSKVTMTSHAVMPAGAGGFTSDSTATVTAASGVAEFTNLKPTRSATLTLSASDGTLAGATSNPFAVIGNPAGLIAGSAGIDQTNPLAIPRSSDMASATIDLLGPTPSDAVTFTVSCAVTMAGALNPPHCSTSPASTTGTDGGVTPISVTLLAFGGSSVPAEHAKPFFLGPQTGLPEFETIALLLAVGFFGLLRIRSVQAPSPRTRCGVAFMFLLCVSLGWMSGCTQFSVPNTPATPIPPTPTGPGSAVVTITPSGAGPGSDAYTTKTVTVYFNVQ